MWPFIGIMSIRVENYGQCHNQGPIEAFFDMIGATLLVFDVQMELL